MKLDEWQEKVLETSGDIVLRSGRQVGKSTIISIKASQYAVQNPNKTILIVASVERQAYLLFEKVLNYMYDKYPKWIGLGKEKPTKHKITLRNGSVIWCLPTGMSGAGIRGYTVDLLIADEAAFIPQDVWAAITPMLAVTKGIKILLSTPHGKEGYFFDCFNDPSFTSFHISSEECGRVSKEFLKREKMRLTKCQYAQEYLGEFVDELRQFFPSELIRKAMSLQRGYPISSGDRFLGVDVARMGEDESVLVSVNRYGDHIWQMDMEVTTKNYLTETISRIKASDSHWNFKKIYIDDGGMGVGVYDPLLLDDQTKRKIVAINNARRSLDVSDSPRMKRTMKEDLYNNLLWLLEGERIYLFDEPEIFLSLSSVQAEYDESGKLKIFGNYTHIVEALIRAVWCMKDKDLNIWVDFI